MNRLRQETYDLVVVGAGPTGLACCVAARRHGLRSIALDKGTVVNTIVGYPTATTFFSTPELLELEGMPFTTPNVRPTRVEAIEYYRGVVRTSGAELALQTRVLRVDPVDNGGFTVATDRGTINARFVVIATGYFDNPNPLSVPGAEFPKVRHYYHEPYEHFGQDVLVIGGRNSAVESALDLYRHGARVTMIHRGDGLGSGVKYWIRPDIENRIKHGDIAVRWETEVESIDERSVTLRNNVTGHRETLPNDAIYAMIGYRPDVDLLSACGITFDPETLIPDHNPETFETAVPGLFLAGSVACGCKTWEIFIENGREHARRVVEVIAGRVSG